MNIKDTRATIWSVTTETTQSGKQIVKGKISTSRKVNDDKYANSNWFVTFVGKSVQQAIHLKEKDRINILNAQITCEPYEKDGRKIYPTKVTIFAFEMAEPKQSEPSGFQSVDDKATLESLPF